MTSSFTLTNTPVSASTGTVAVHTPDAASRTPDDQIAKPVIENKLQHILDASGVLPQINNLYPTLFEESREHWQHCKSADTQLAPWLKEAFGADKINRIAIKKLQEIVDTATIKEILRWLDSSSGQAIIGAERSSASLSEADFERYISELATSPGYRTERAPRIRALIDTTRAGYFVSVLNTELNGIVSLSIACSPSHETMEKLLSTTRAERQDLELVSFFMSINLHAPTAVVYRQIEDHIIDDYLEFSASDAGKAYHAALIEVTRSTLVNRLEALAHWRSSKL